MDDFKSNSHTSRDAKSDIKRVKKVTSKPIKTKKKSGVQKLKDSFISEDVHTVKSYIINEIIVPTIKDTLVEIIQSGAERIFGYESRRTKRRKNTPYDNPTIIRDVSRYGNSYRRDDRKKTHKRDFYKDIIFDSKSEALDIIEELEACINKYGQATLNDLYETMDIESDYIDFDWGWTDLRGATANLIRGEGYVLDLPRLEYLK